MPRIAVAFAPEDAAASVARIEAWAISIGWEVDRIGGNEAAPEIAALRRRIALASGLIILVTPHWTRDSSCRAAFREARLLRCPVFPIIVGSDGELVVGGDISRTTLSDTEAAGLTDLAAGLLAQEQTQRRLRAGRGNYRFKAFLSYSHRDKPYARWLHRALEAYRLPRQLVGRPTDFGEVPRNLGKAFRDDEELKGAADLGALIQGALEESETLVVICSPRSAGSTYVDQEIASFKRLGRESRIVPVIIDGKPHDLQAECFPPALTRKAGPDGLITDEPAEPIAVDIREHGRRRTLLKVVAGITGVDFDELEQRDHRRRRQQRALLVGTAAIALFGLTVTSAIVDQVEGRRAAVAAAAQILLEHQPVRSARMAVAALPSGSDLMPLGVEAASTLRATGYAYETTLLDAGKRYNTLEFSDDGERLVTVDGNGEVVLWDARALQVLKALDFTYYGGPTAFAKVSLGSDSRLVTSPDGDGAAQLWDLRSGEWIASLGSDSERVLTVKLARDGGSAVVVYGDAPAKLFSLADASELATFEAGSDAIDISADGTRVAMRAPNDGPTKLWEAPTGRLVAQLEVGRNSTRPRFTSNGNTLITASPDVGAMLWDAKDGKLLARMGGPDGAEREVLSADGLRLATIGRDGVAALWDLLNGHRIATIGEPHTTDVEFADGFGKVITKTAELQAFVSDAGTGAPIGRLGEPGEGYRLHFSASGRRVVFATRSFSAVLRDATTGELVAHIALDNDAHEVRTSKDRRILEADDANHWVRQWDMETGAFIAALAGPREGHRWFVNKDRSLAIVISAFGEALVRRINSRIDVEPQALRAQTCAINRNIIGPFQLAERDRSHPVGKLLFGRPWHPCDWRGLKTMEGWVQTARYWGSRAGLPLDYSPE